MNLSKHLILTLTTALLLTACESSWEGIKASSVLSPAGSNTGASTSGNNNPGTPTPTPTPIPAPVPAPVPVPEPVPVPAPVPALVCKATEHIEKDVCVANVRACAINDGAGEETWDGQKFGSCALKTCNSGYQVTAGQCTKSFVGKFKMPCGPEGTLESIYINDFIDDVKHDLIAKVYNPATGTCLDQTLYREVRQIGTYQRLGLSQSSPGSVEIDFANPQIEITLRSALAVSDHNLVSSCGKTNWVIDTPFVFTRAQCSAPGGYPKSINKVDGDLLYIGDFGGLKDANGRPLNLILDPKKISTRF